MENIKKVWPKWKVIETLGQGGFGTVYKACREEFGTKTYSAIKVIKIPNNDLETKEMVTSGMNVSQVKEYYKQNVVSLVNEIKLMETLKAVNNIVSIEDFEMLKNEEGIGWTILIRMELLTNISDYFKENQIKTSDIVKLGIDMCSALERCHNMNIIHRDIKPGNIFISQFGDFKLGDFGVSRQTEQSIATMSQKGTKSYMAPEMIRMEKYGKDVDLYALGLTMYELLNHGRMPFLPVFPEPFFPQDREVAMFKRLSGEAFPDIEGIGSLNAIIQKACHFDSKQRYQNAKELKQALINYLTESNNDEEKIDEFIGVETNDETTIGMFGNNIDLFLKDDQEEKIEQVEEVKVEKEIKQEKEIVYETIVEKPKKKVNKLLFIIPLVLLVIGGVVLGTVLSSGNSNSATNTELTIDDKYAQLLPYATDIYYETNDGVVDITVIDVNDITDMELMPQQSNGYVEYGLLVLEVRSTPFEYTNNNKFEKYDLIESFNYCPLKTIDQFEAMFEIGGNYELLLWKHKANYKEGYEVTLSKQLNPSYDENVFGFTVVNVSDLQYIYDNDEHENVLLTKDQVYDLLSICQQYMYTECVIVSDVKENSLAQLYGFQYGDVIWDINNTAIYSAIDLQTVDLKKTQPEQIDTFMIYRNGENKSIEIYRP